MKGSLGVKPSWDTGSWRSHQRALEERKPSAGICGNFDPTTKNLKKLHSIKSNNANMLV